MVAKFEEVVEKAFEWQRISQQLLSKAERVEQVRYAQLVKNPQGKLLLLKLLDQAFRTSNDTRLAEQVRFLFNHYGIPAFFSPLEKFLIRLFLKTGHWAPSLSMPLLKYKLRLDTRKVVLNEDASSLPHFQQRKAEGIKVNVNIIGELVLGEKEAESRLNHYLEVLHSEHITYLSVKASCIYSQLHPLGHHRSLDILIKRLSQLYRTAIENPTLNEQGTKQPKFINMDMEEYKDLELTVECFIKTLEQPEFQSYKAGIVLQAYLPDAHQHQVRLTEWAQERVEQGGAPIKIRIVKGANLQMESVDSSRNVWPLPNYDSKVEVDANFKLMMDYALQPDHLNCVHIGMGSHNLFDMAYAQVLLKETPHRENFTYEMLEGLASHTVRTLNNSKQPVLLYTPLVPQSQFLNALSYLVRRLDENTGKENFLTHSFNLSQNSKSWDFLQEQFRQSLELKDKIFTGKKRKQDRSLPPLLPASEQEFRNEPNTDFHLKANREWAERIREEWKTRSQQPPVEIRTLSQSSPFGVSGVQEFRDINQFQGPVLYNIHLNSQEEVMDAVALAKQDPQGWRKTPFSERKSLLLSVAHKLREKRGQLLGCMAAITGKAFIEGDVEISEAIDFAEYYPRSLEPFLQMEIEAEPKGVVLVISPWNFPTAIPSGGVSAALAAGNTVLLKPAPEAFPVAWEFAQCFWEAGIPREAFQVIFCAEGEVLSKLSGHPVIDHIIFTGGTDTALKIIQNNPTCPVSAETGGKNAIIATALCDRDQAIKSIVKSAFGNAGQKCSAASLLLLEKEIYHDEQFKEKLLDAAESFTLGGAWDLHNYMGPLILPPNEKLNKAMELEAGEEWLLKPQQIKDNPRLWTPGIKWGVRPDSYTFTTELFAPLLAVTPIENLEQGISIINGLEYGLTSGLQSLDEREHQIWKNKIEAGNLYINREITGAIVQRQPFGGLKRSSFGSGLKAGGPNYAIQFMEISEKGSPSVKESFDLIPECGDFLSNEEKSQLKHILGNYTWNMNQYFSKEWDPSQILGEDNVLRYIPCGTMHLRLYKKDSPLEILMALYAIHMTGNHANVSLSDETHSLSELIALYSSHSNQKFEVTQEPDADFIKKLPQVQRLRLLGEIPTALIHPIAKQGTTTISVHPFKEGRIELLHYLQEQSITHEYHRYGNLGEKQPS